MGEKNCIFAFAHQLNKHGKNGNIEENFGGRLKTISDLSRNSYLWKHLNIQFDKCNQISTHRVFV